MFWESLKTASVWEKGNGRYTSSFNTYLSSTKDSSTHAHVLHRKVLVVPLFATSHFGISLVEIQNHKLNVSTSILFPAP